MKKIIVAGPRDYVDKEYIYQILDMYINMLYLKVTDNVEIVEGGARGVDSIARDYAKDYQLYHKQFPADWGRNGRSAGPIRNQQMAEYADVLIAFYNGSRGTSNMIKQAMENGLSVHIIPIQ